MDIQAKSESAVLTENGRAMADILDGLTPEQANRVMQRAVDYMAGAADLEKRVAKKLEAAGA